MTDDRLTKAIERLDRAITKIEARDDASGKASQLDETNLARRHAMLQASTRSAIERLDRLIGVDERG